MWTITSDQRAAKVKRVWGTLQRANMEASLLQGNAVNSLKARLALGPKSANLLWPMAPQG